MKYADAIDSRIWRAYAIIFMLATLLVTCLHVYQREQYQAQIVRMQEQLKEVTDDNVRKTQRIVELTGNGG